MCILTSVNNFTYRLLREGIIHRKEYGIKGLLQTYGVRTIMLVLSTQGNSVIRNEK